MQRAFTVRDRASRQGAGIIGSRRSDRLLPRIAASGFARLDRLACSFGAPQMPLSPLHCLRNCSTSPLPVPAAAKPITNNPPIKTKRNKFS